MYRTKHKTTNSLFLELGKIFDLKRKQVQLLGTYFVKGKVSNTMGRPEKTFFCWRGFLFSHLKLFEKWCCVQLHIFSRKKRPHSDCFFFHPPAIGFFPTLDRRCADEYPPLNSTSRLVGVGGWSLSLVSPTQKDLYKGTKKVCTIKKYTGSLSPP